MKGRRFFVIIAIMAFEVVCSIKKFERIIGGRQVTFSERKFYKHQVFFIFYIDNETKRTCSGSIISERVIITAAHCTKDKIKAEVYTGLYYKNKLNTAAQKILITSKDWIGHPHYVSEPTINDVSVINLPVRIKFGTLVGPIQIECNDKNRYENETVVVSGWGRYSKSNNTSLFLRTAKVKIAPADVCKKAKFYRWRTWGKYFPSMICVSGANSVGACKGDSGGPIVSTRTGKLLGVSSIGFYECTNSKPRIFTRLSSFAKWIKDHSVGHIKNC